MPQRESTSNSGPANSSRIGNGEDLQLNESTHPSRIWQYKNGLGLSASRYLPYRLLPSLLLQPKGTAPYKTLCQIAIHRLIKYFQEI